MIGTRNAGFFIYDLNFFANGKNFDFRKKDAPPTILQKLKDDAVDYINQNQLYSAAKINDNLFAYGTTTGGIVLVDKTGTAVRIINKNRGLSNNCIYALYTDISGNLWAGTQAGLSRIDLSYPLNSFNEELNDFAGYVISTVKNGNDFYAGTMSAVYKFTNPTDVKSLSEKYSPLKISQQVSEYWNFETFGDIVLVTGGNALNQVVNDKLISILPQQCYFVKNPNITKMFYLWG